jgi:MoaA/NifB/PqqE/SkfB family radical SAM enzyme
MLELRIMKSIIKVVAKRKVPLRVSYFCTFRCNLRCEYCGLWKTKRNEMTTEQAKSMIGDFASAGTMFWMFTGGEPMLRRDIGELVSEARGSGMVVGLVTNGTMLTRKLDELT